MAKKKSQKDLDLKELTEKLKAAKSVVFTDYRGTTVKDIDRFRKILAKEGVFSKVYKLTLVKKAMDQVGVAGTVDYKTPVIMSVSAEDETTPARLIKALGKDMKTLTILQGIVDGKMVDKTQVLVLADLPTKDQLRSQFMSVLKGPMSAFARAINALAEKMGSAAPAAPAAPEAAKDQPAAPAPEAAPAAA